MPIVIKSKVYFPELNLISIFLICNLPAASLKFNLEAK